MTFKNKNTAKMTFLYKITILEDDLLKQNYITG